MNGARIEPAAAKRRAATKTRIITRGDSHNFFCDLRKRNISTKVLKKFIKLKFVRE